ncbi:MAG: ComF family protein [Vannielia sp.]|uniref:ComF family protein n=1 Tax=Vannielia sp. TaxID=2813045 RepID=UPI003B8D1384
MQRLLQAIYPDHCLSCGEVSGSDGGLCAACWRDTAFITGLVCDRCGAPLPGDEDEDDESTPALTCDDCLTIARPWSRGRAALLYRGNGRRIVLALKSHDRADLAQSVAPWLARAAAPIYEPGMLLAPVPLHWFRLFRRRYNQSALLARALARQLGAPLCPDLLLRARHTPRQEGLGAAARFANMAEAIHPHPGRRHRMAARKVLLVDDVLTSGATLAACAEACLGAGAAEVRVLTLARTVKDA